MSDHWIYYFGYGSLVNRDTRPPDEVAYPAKLLGWQRVWQHRSTAKNNGFSCTSLSIEPLDDPKSGHIDGVVVRLPKSELPQLDERESGYDRMSLPASNFELPSGVNQPSVVVYQSQLHNRSLANANHPILQSYIDCVMAGYLLRFGEAGLLSMVTSTRGWDACLLNDRANPHYPRHVSIEHEKQVMFDELLSSEISRTD